ncbi:MAG: hypothetical protein HYY23_21455 [Verrucomicrobia bacterium]|nr:hypothetical protein [Verrucomicrobiota bacterium]
MTFTGKVIKGAIVLPPHVKLPEGLQLEVNIPELPAQEPAIHERLMKFAGIIQNLPRDFARNHDHYIHGAPKR